MVNKPFLLLSLAAEYRSQRRRRSCDKHCGRPSDVYDTDRRTKLIALETISRWLLLKKRKNRSLSHPFGHLGITYALRLWLIGKPVVDFIFVVIELFCYLLQLRRYERKSVEVGVFRRGVGHFERRFQREGGIADQPLLVSSSRVIALSCGIKISAVRHLVLSQSTRVTDR